LRQQTAHAEDHQRARPAELTARGLDALEGLEDRGFVGRRVADYLRQALFELLELVLLRLQRRLERLEDLIELLDLVGREREFALEAVVLPPLETLRVGGSRQGDEGRRGQ